MVSFRRLLMLHLVAVLALLGATVGVAQAHVLKQDNGMSAVLHIPPEDNPKAGQPTELDIEFYDQQDNFDINNCTCGVTVMQGTTVIQKATLQAHSSGDVLNTTTNVTFPKVGIYNVIVSGKAKDGAFGAFTLNYLERVASTADGSGPTANGDGGGSEAIIVGAAGLIILVMIAYSGITNGGRYAKPTKTVTKTNKKPAKPRAVTKKVA